MSELRDETLSAISGASKLLVAGTEAGVFPLLNDATGLPTFRYIEVLPLPASAPEIVEALLRALERRPTGNWLSETLDEQERLVELVAALGEERARRWFDLPYIMLKHLDPGKTRSQPWAWKFTGGKKLDARRTEFVVGEDLDRQKMATELEYAMQSIGEARQIARVGTSVGRRRR